MREDFYCKVVDNNDPKKQGRVQIFSESLMSGWQSSHYPWARPKTQRMGGANDSGQSNIPEIGTWLWCFAEKNHTKKNWYYENGLELANLNPHSLFDQNVKSNINSQSQYPNTKFEYYKNGISLGVDSSSSNPEIFIYHPKGTFVFIDNTGKIMIQGPKDINIKSSTKVVLDTPEVDIKGKLNVDQEIIWNNATVPTHASTHNHTSAAPGNPTTRPNPGS